MEFAGDIGLWQRRIAESTEGVARRLAVLDALQPRVGGDCLDIGCGSGHLVQEMARAVGSAGRVAGIDLSADQVAAAERLCRDLPHAEVMVADVCDLPFEAGRFDFASSIQTLEYVPDIDRALSEIRRVLRNGGRVAFVSVLWDTFRFHGADEDLNRRMTEAWRAHCPHQMLPAEMPPRMARAGFHATSQRPLAFFNASFHENCLSFWAAKLIVAFAQSQGVAKEDAESWHAQLLEADRDGRFGFVSVPVLTVGVAV